MPWQTNGLRDGFPISFSAVKLSPFPLLELEATRIFSWVFMFVGRGNTSCSVSLKKKKGGPF